ncbi:TrkH family potassium uptake protein [Candidatus Woesearchaeota archaeon]|nr:TrkH family potassium uptake protein [Candidatus Woesearchaeota archaeon]
MKWQHLAYVQANLLIWFSIFLFAPLFVALIYHEPLAPFFITMCITFSSAMIFHLIGKIQNTTLKETYFIITSTWIIFTIVSSLPFMISGISTVDSVFEAMSGITTTGATILTDIEAQPVSILFWRAMLHWFGGIGVILLSIAILPFFGADSPALYNAEATGPLKTKIRPRMRDTAKVLIIVYLTLTISETLLLMFLGMPFFHAVTTAFSTVATGGFSFLNDSIAGYQDMWIEIVITFFMYLAGINFLLYFYIFKNKLSLFFKDTEWRIYTLIMVLSTLGLAAYLNIKSVYAIGDALRYASFQVASIMTTTGFVTADYSLWPHLSWMLFIVLMFLGGSAGSTVGGVKIMRFILLFKIIRNEMRKVIHPDAFFSFNHNGKPLRQEIISSLLAYVFLFFVSFIAITLFLTIFGYDLITSFSASMATLTNTGPGLGAVGPIENFGFFDPASKIVLTFAMLLGRLEFFAVLVFVYLLIKR